MQSWGHMGAGIGATFTAALKTLVEPRVTIFLVGRSLSQHWLLKERGRREGDECQEQFGFSR